MTEGDSVTLHTDVTELQRDNVILWTFGPQNTHIAKINRVHNETFHNGADERFRDRLKLDSQTGSLTISNISTEHNGLYKVEIVNENKVSSKDFIVKIYGKQSIIIMHISTLLHNLILNIVFKKITANIHNSITVITNMVM